MGRVLDSPHGCHSNGLHRPEAGAARGGPPRRRPRLRPAGGDVPARASRPLLPDARLGARRRRRAPGHSAAGLARAARVRWPPTPSPVALQKRNQRRPGPSPHPTHPPPPAPLAPRSQQAGRPSAGDRRLRESVRGLSGALEAGRVEVSGALLAVDATFARPPYPGWCRGRDALSKSWLMPGGPPAGIRYVPTRANGQLALGAYKLDPQQDSYLPVALDVLSFQNTPFTAITAFRTPQVFPPSASPTRLPAN